MKTLIKVTNVSKAYDELAVLDRISFEIEEGSFTTLIGHNGAGKSTSLRLLSGHEKTDAGKVEVFGKDPFAHEFDQRSDLFFIHEDIKLNLPVSLATFISAYKDVFPKWDMPLFKLLIKNRKLNLKKKYADFSRGQKMQFMISVALASNAKILFLDEITAVLDIDAQLYFLDKLREHTMNGGVVIISTNILNEINNYATHVLMVQQAKLVVDCKVEKLREQFTIMKKIMDHPFYESDKIARVSSRGGEQTLYVTRSHMIPDVLRSAVTDHPVSLADVVQLHFKDLQGDENENLVA